MAAVMSAEEMKAVLAVVDICGTTGGNVGIVSEEW